MSDISPPPIVYCVGPSMTAAVKRRHIHSKIIHRPVIRLHSLPLSTHDRQNKSIYQALILTSKHAAQESRRLFLFKKLSCPLPRIIISVGKATANESKKLYRDYCKRWRRKINRSANDDMPPIFLTALEEMQEGVIQLIKKNLDPHQGSLLWICSTHSRETLIQEARALGFSLEIVRAYTPISQHVKISLRSQDIVFFSCPSSARSFFQFSYKNCRLARIDPSHFETIGPITQAALDEILKNKYL